MPDHSYVRVIGALLPRFPARPVRLPVVGRYELVCPPELIVMRWDFEDDNVPIPGGEMTGYLRVTPGGAGAHVEVHQVVDTPVQAEFMQQAWTMVLGRFNAGVASAISVGQEPAPKAPRPKRRSQESGS
jgi:hypothetical protein